MPIPKRKKGEKTAEYRSRLISFLVREGKTQKQAVGEAFGIVPGRKKKVNKKKK